MIGAPGYYSVHESGGSGMASKYRAFVSYSHGDERWAAWLQRALERYRVPARLAEAVRPARDIPRRLYPVFRDRSELSSSSDLGAALKQSLRDSETLIVVCSRAAAKSRWLDEEVQYFKSLGRADRVLCFMVDGSPDIGADDCAFPQALIESDAHGEPIEPLAADPRVDGKRDALLKIVGGMLDVGIDDLKQRDAQRRARVWAGIAASSMVLAVAMVGLALYAVAAQKEAELRRGQAENLIGFMLGDLRKRLQPIGRLDVLDAVGDEAMKYFEALDENATPQDLLSRAMALRQIGEVRFNQGQLEPALLAFVESRSLLERLFADDSSVDDYLFELGQSEFWVGYVYYERALYDEAVEAMTNYMEISRKLLERQPHNQDFRAELAYAYSNLGSVARAQGDNGAAIAYFRESVAVNERQLVEQPGDVAVLADLAGGYSWIGSAEQDLGNLEAAETAFRAALDRFDALVQAQDNADYLERRATSQGFLSDILLLRGKLEEARALGRRSYDEFRRLVGRDPDNGRWRRGLAVSARDQAELEHYAGNPERAVEYLSEAEREYERLLAVDPTNARWRSARLSLNELEIRIRFDTGADAATLRSALVDTFREAMAIIEDRDETNALLETLALLMLTDAAASGDDRPASLTRARQVFDRLMLVKEPSIVMRACLVPIARRLGEDVIAAAQETSVRRSGLAHPLFAKT